MIATRAPRPPMNGSGSRNPNIARLGIVCATLASHTIGARAADVAPPECRAAHRSRPRRPSRAHQEHDAAPSSAANSPRCAARNCRTSGCHRAGRAAPRSRNAAAASTSGSSNARTRGSSTRAIARRRIERGQHAVGEHADTRGQRERLAHVVRHDEDGLPQLRLDAAELAMHLARVTGSSAPNGSSISRIGGSAASARATPTRWRCPPDSSCGRRGRVVAPPAGRPGRAARDARADPRLRPTRAAAARRRRFRRRSGAERARSPGARSRCGAAARTDPTRACAATNDDVAGVRREEPIDQLEDGALAGAAAADERERFALVDGEVQPAEHRAPPRLMCTSWNAISAVRTPR